MHLYCSAIHVCLQEPYHIRVASGHDVGGHALRGAKRRARPVVEAANRVGQVDRGPALPSAAPYDTSFCSASPCWRHQSARITRSVPMQKCFTPMSR